MGSLTMKTQKRQQQQQGQQRQRQGQMMMMMMMGSGHCQLIWLQLPLQMGWLAWHHLQIQLAVPLTSS
jgi:hypothetical protein